MRAPPLPASVPCPYSKPTLPCSRALMRGNNVDEEDVSSFRGETCLTHRGSASHSTPRTLWGMDRPRYKGENRGLGQGVGGGEGLLHLPPRKWADPGALRPRGSEPSDQPAGRAPADWGSCPALSFPGRSREECNSREPRLNCGDSPVEGGGSLPAPVPALPTPLSRAGDGPA